MSKINSNTFDERKQKSIIDLDTVKKITFISFTNDSSELVGVEKIVDFEDMYEITIGEVCAEFFKSLIKIDYK